MITLITIGVILLLLSIRVWYRELKLNKDIAGYWLYLSANYIAGWVLYFIYWFYYFAINNLP